MFIQIKLTRYVILCKGPLLGVKFLISRRKFIVFQGNSFCLQLYSKLKLLIIKLKTTKTCPSFSNIYHRRTIDPLYNKWSFFQIYDTCSWSVIGLTLLLQAFFYVANLYCECMYERINFTKISDALWRAVQLHLRQAIKGRWSSLSVKFNILLISLLQAVIIMGIYSSYILR